MLNLKRLASFLVFTLVLCISPPSFSAEPGSPLALKEGAIQKLEDVKTGNSKDDKKIDKVIEEIQKSLEKDGKPLFISDFRIDSKHGKKVFEHESKAVEKALKEIDKEKLPQVVLDVMAKVIDDLVEADAIIANDVLIAAILFAGSDDEHVQEAQEALDEATDYILEGEPKKAIEAFKEAWEEATEVVKIKHNLQIIAFSDSPDPFSPNADLTCDSNTLIVNATMDSNDDDDDDDDEDHDDDDEDDDNDDEILFMELEQRIFNPSGVLIRSLTNRVPVMQGQSSFNFAVTWDGKDAAGVQSADGDYTYLAFVRLIKIENDDDDHNDEDDEDDDEENESTEKIKSVSFPVVGTITIDTVLPTLSITSPPAGDISNDNTPLIRISYDDDRSGVDLSSLAISLNGNDITSSFTINANEATFQVTTALADSEHTLEVSIRDLACNTSTTSSTFTTDVTVPQISGLTPVTGSILNNATPGMSATFSDNLSGINSASVVITLDGNDITGQATVTASGFTFTPATSLSEGSHTLTVDISDIAGNAATQALSTFTIDITDPLISDVEPADGSEITDTAPQMSASFSDNLTGIDTGSVAIILDSIDITSSATVTASGFSFVPTASLGLGPHTLSISVSDAAGNTTVAITSFSIISPAEVAAFFPQSGSKDGGTRILILGSGFSDPPVTSVKFGPNEARSFKVLGDTTIEAVSPAGVGTVEITVGNNPLSMETLEFSVTNDPNSGNSLGFAIENALPSGGLFSYGSFAIPGFISFAPKVDVLTGNNVADIVVGDFDGDGKIDLAGINQFDSNVAVYRNISPGPGVVSFDTGITFASDVAVRAVTTGDFDGDGKLDLATADFLSMSMSVYLNQSTGPGDINFTQEFIFLSGQGTAGLVAADFDQDGKTDLARPVFFENKISIFKNTSTGIGNIDFALAVDLPTNPGPGEITLADFDHDGLLDLVTPDSGSNLLSLYPNTSSGGALSFGTRIDIPAGLTGPFGVTAEDFDDDGFADLAVGFSLNNTQISVLRNTSTATGDFSFDTPLLIPSGSNPIRVTTGDFDGDGKMDLVATDRSLSPATNGISVYRNLSTGPGTIAFAPRINFESNPNPTDLVATDFDGDGRTDIASADGLSNKISVFRNSSEADTEDPTVEIIAPIPPIQNRFFFFPFCVFDDGDTTVIVRADDDTAIVTVKLFAKIGSDPEFLVDTLTFSPYIFQVSIPAGAGGFSPFFGPVITLRAEVTDRVGKTGTSTILSPVIVQRPGTVPTGYIIEGLAEQVTAGEEQTIIIRAIDDTGVLTPGYNGQGLLRSSDPAFPVFGRSIFFVNGIATVQLTEAFGANIVPTLKTLGDQSIVINDFNNFCIQGATVTTIIPGPASVITPVTTGQQSFDSAVSVLVTDLGGNPIAGVEVEFEFFNPLVLRASDVAVSDSNGVASVPAVPDSAQGLPSHALNIRVNLVETPTVTATFTITDIKIIIQPATDLVQAGVPFDVTLMAVNVDGDLQENFEGTIILANMDMSPTLTVEVQFTAADRGIVTIPAGIYMRLAVLNDKPLPRAFLQSAAPTQLVACYQPFDMSSIAEVGFNNDIDVLPGEPTVFNTQFAFVYILDAWGNTVPDMAVEVIVNVQGQGQIPTEIWYTTLNGWLPGWFLAPGADISDLTGVTVDFRIIGNNVTGGASFAQQPSLFDVFSDPLQSHQDRAVSLQEKDIVYNGPVVHTFSVAKEQIPISETNPVLIPLEGSMTITHDFDILKFTNVTSTPRIIMGRIEGIVAADNMRLDDTLASSSLQITSSGGIFEVLEETTGVTETGPAQNFTSTYRRTIVYQMTIQPSNQGIIHFESFTASGLDMLFTQSDRVSWIHPGENANLGNPIYFVTFGVVSFSENNQSHIRQITRVKEDWMGFLTSGNIPGTSVLVDFPGYGSGFINPSFEGDWQIRVYDIEDSYDLLNTMELFADPAGHKLTVNTPFGLLPERNLDLFLWSFDLAGDRIDHDFPNDRDLPGFTVEAIDANGNLIIDAETGQVVAGSRLTDMPAIRLQEEVYQSKAAFVAVSKQLREFDVPTGRFSENRQVSFAPTRSAFANGTDVAEMRVRIFDSLGAAVPGASVSVNAGKPGFDTVTGVALEAVSGDGLEILTDSTLSFDPVFATTDANGEFVVSLSTSSAGAKLVEVSLTLEGQPIVAQAQAVFYPIKYVPLVVPEGAVRIRVTQPASLTNFLKYEQASGATFDAPGSKSIEILRVSGDLKIKPEAETAFRGMGNAIVKGLTGELQVTVPDWVFEFDISPEQSEVKLEIDDGISATPDKHILDFGSPSNPAENVTFNESTSTATINAIPEGTFQIGLNRIRIPLIGKTFYCFVYLEQLRVGEIDSGENEHDDGALNRLNPFQPDKSIEDFILNGNDPIQTNNFQTILPERIVILFDDNLSDAGISSILKETQVIPLAYTIVPDVTKLVEVFSPTIKDPFLLEESFDSNLDIRGASVIHVSFYYTSFLDDPNLIAAIETDMGGFLKGDGGSIGSETPITVESFFIDDSMISEVSPPIIVQDFANILEQENGSGGEEPDWETDDGRLGFRRQGGIIRAIDLGRGDRFMWFEVNGELFTQKVAEKRVVITNVNTGEEDFALDWLPENRRELNNFELNFISAEATIENKILTKLTVFSSEWLLVVDVNDLINELIKVKLNNPNISEVALFDIAVNKVVVAITISVIGGKVLKLLGKGLSLGGKAFKKINFAPQIKHSLERHSRRNFKFPAPGLSNNQLKKQGFNLATIFPDDWIHDDMVKAFKQVIDKASANPQKLIKEVTLADGTIRLVMEAIVDIEGKKGVQVVRVVLQEGKEGVLDFITGIPITGDKLKFYVPSVDSQKILDTIPQGFENKFFKVLTGVLDQ